MIGLLPVRAGKGPPRLSPLLLWQTPPIPRIVAYIALIHARGLLNIFLKCGGWVDMEVTRCRYRVNSTCTGENREFWFQLDVFSAC